MPVNVPIDPTMSQPVSGLYANAVVAYATANLMDIIPDDADDIGKAGPCYLRSGLRSNFGLHNRTRRVLDALADISVSEPRGEVVAVALHMASSDIRLYMATNNSVPDPTIAYLNRVWELLQRISDEYASGRERQGGRSRWLGYLDTPPERENYGTKSTDLRLEDRLAATIYCHTHRKFRKRFDKWYPQLMAFWDKYSKIWKSRQGDNYVVASVELRMLINLELVMSTLERCNKLLLDFDELNWDLERMPYNKWHGYWFSMSSLVGVTSEVLKEPHVLDTWAVGVTKAGEKIPRLQRIIEKIVSFPRQILTLINFARSPHLRPIFTDTTFDIIPIATRQKILIPPRTIVTFWDHIRSFIYEDIESVFDNLPHFTHVHPHCECALIAYLHNHPTTAAFSYIGVSKLSCQPCQIWIDGYNQLPGTHPHYCTRGSHAKWYPGWAVPVLADAQRQQALEEFVEKEAKRILFEHLPKVKYGGKMPSDSTDASGPTDCSRQRLELKEYMEKDFISDHDSDEGLLFSMEE